MPRFKLAASNIGWTSHDDERVLQAMAHLQFAGLEVAPTRLIPQDPYDHDQEATQIMEDIHAAHGLQGCSIQSIWRGRDESIFSEAGSQALLGVTERAAAFAHAIGAQSMVFGCPRNRSIPEGKSAEDAYPFLRRCAQAAHEQGVVFALEANPPLYHTNFMNSTSDALHVLEALGFPPGMALNLDTGTMIENGESVEDVVSALPHVSHVHISEPGLAPLKQRALHAELADALDRCGYAGFISLEASTRPADEVIEDLRYLASVF